MNSPYHREILTRALSQHLSPRAIAAIAQANVDQDRLILLLTHLEYHFDNDLFAEGLAYIEECRQVAARATTADEAWAAFGRLTHAAQDFYAHSNYVRLWAEQHPNTLPPPATINALDPQLLKHPRLASGYVYWVRELLYMIPGLQKWVYQIAPKNSHIVMNLDQPSTGVLFPYAMEAATQRTIVEYERTLALIGEEQGEEAMRRFCDRA